MGEKKKRRKKKNKRENQAVIAKGRMKRN